MYKWIAIHTKHKKYPYFFTNVSNVDIDYLKDTVTIKYKGNTIKGENTAIIKNFEAIMTPKKEQNNAKNELNK